MEKKEKSTLNLAQCSHHDLVWSKHFYRGETAFANTEIYEALHFVKKGYPLRWTNETAIFLYEFLRKHGEHYEALKQEVVVGNIDLGATYTSPYTSFVTNEILARQVIYGKKWLEDVFPGLNARVFYNTDVPGLNHQIPQLYKKAGLDYIFMSRSWQFPNIKQNAYSTWESPDGTTIKTFFMKHYGDLYFKHFKDKDFIEYIENEWIENRDNVKDPLLVFGMDCLLPLNLDRQVNLWNDYAKTKGYPAMNYSTMIHGLDQGFQNVQTYDNTFKGEWPNSWVYENSCADYPTFKNQKDAEKMLVTAEQLFVWRAMTEGSFKHYDVTRFEKAWRLVMKACHGYAPREGIEEYREWYQEAYTRAFELQQEGLFWLASQVKAERRGQPVVVYNSLNNQRDSYAIVEPKSKSSNIIVKNAKGDTVKSGFTSENKIIFEVKNINGFGYETFYLIEGKGEQSGEAEIALDQYENDFYRIEMSCGGLKSIYDKQAGVELFDTDKFLIGELLTFNYEGCGAGEHINIWQPHPEIIERSKELSSKWRVKEVNDVRVVFEMTTRMSYSTFILDVNVYTNKKKIEFNVQLRQTKAPDKYQVRLAFPVNGTDMFRENSKTNVVYEVPYGQVHIGKSEVLPQFSQFNKNLGVEIDTNHIYNNGIRPREVQNNVVASVEKNNQKVNMVLSSYNVPWDYQDATVYPRRTPVLQPVLFSNSNPCHGLCDYWHSDGDMRFEFSLGSEIEGGGIDLYKQAIGNNSPLHVVNCPLGESGVLKDTGMFMEVCSEHVHVTAVKKAEVGDKIVIRYYEGYGQSGDVRFAFKKDVAKAYEASTDERILDEINVVGNTVKKTVKAHEINTLVVEVEDMRKVGTTPKHLMITETTTDNVVTLKWQNVDEAKMYSIKHSLDNVNWHCLGQTELKEFKTQVEKGDHYFKVAAVYEDTVSFDSVEVGKKVDNIIQNIRTEGTDYTWICCHQYLVTDVGISEYTKDGLHNTIDPAMHTYLTKDNPEEDIFVSFEFERVYDLDEMYIWNFQDKVTEKNPYGANAGFREVRIYYSVDGVCYTQLECKEQSNEGVYTFAKSTEVAVNKDQMPASNLHGTNKPVNLRGVKAKFIKFIVSNQVGVGNYGYFEKRDVEQGGNRNVFGLAKVLFTFEQDAK